MCRGFFLISVSRLPGRIYPYYLLAKLYSEPNYRDKDKFEDMKWNVLNRTPKVHSTAIEEMRQEVEEMAKIGIRIIWNIKRTRNRIWKLIMITGMLVCYSAISN